MDNVDKIHNSLQSERYVRMVRRYRLRMSGNGEDRKRPDVMILDTLSLLPGVLSGWWWRRGGWVVVVGGGGWVKI